MTTANHSDVIKEIKLSDNSKYKIGYSIPSNGLERFRVMGKDEGVIFEFDRTLYPSCCGINILHNFYANPFKTISPELIKATLSAFSSKWRNKTQFVAVKYAEMIYEYEYDEHDEVVGETFVRREMRDVFNHHSFIESLISCTNAKLISEFINTNSNNTCFVYEFDGSSL